MFLFFFFRREEGVEKSVPRAFIIRHRGPCAAPDTAKGPQLNVVSENPTHGGLHVRVMMEASALKKTLVLVCLRFVACFF